MVSDIRFYRVFGIASASVALAATFAACAPFSVSRDDTPPVDARRSDDPTVPAKAIVDGGPASADAGASPGNQLNVGADVFPAAGPGCNGAIDCERVVFVSSEAVWGSLIFGVSGADDMCNRLASASTQPRIKGRRFVAWLSDDTRSPSTSFVRSTKAYVRPDGARIATDYGDLTSGDQLEAPIEIDEQGRQQSGLVWSATLPSGDHSGASCSGWQDPSASGALGTITSDAAKWTWTPKNDNWSEVATDDCSSTDSHIYCFEQ